MNGNHEAQIEPTSRSPSDVLSGIESPNLSIQETIEEFRISEEETQNLTVAQCSLEEINNFQLVNQNEFKSDSRCPASFNRPERKYPFCEQPHYFNVRRPLKTMISRALQFEPLFPTRHREESMPKKTEQKGRSRCSSSPKPPPSPECTESNL